MKEVYKELVAIVKDNLENSESVFFEMESFIDENILDFYAKKLLTIEDNKNFLIESYFKLLDRPIDERSLKYYLKQLDTNSITKDDLILKLLNSEERKNQRCDDRKHCNDQRDDRDGARLSDW